MTYPHYRDIVERLRGQPTHDGAGVVLTRMIGGGDLRRFDPFLMLDRFDSEDSADYIGGFPPHPHRGFETITCMLAGYMNHEDHLGHRGRLQPDGMQWMVAGRGIIHSEMPEVALDRMSGVQLWLNLPASDKLTTPSYRDYAPEELPWQATSHGAQVRVLAGHYREGALQISGSVQRPRTDPQLYDLQMPAQSCVQPELGHGYNLMLLVLQGELLLRGSSDQPLATGELVRLGSGDRLHLQASSDARVLLLAGLPLNEPIVQYGPFVMNSRAEIEQAVDDYRNGRF